MLFLDQYVYIGNSNSITQHVMLDGRGAKIIIGNYCDIGMETHIWTLEHDPNSDNHESRGGEVIIEDYVWIASRVTILPGIKIGRGAVIGACSIVTKDVEPLSIMVGNPAKNIGVRKSKLNYNPSAPVAFR